MRNGVLMGVALVANAVHIIVEEKRLLAAVRIVAFRTSDFGVR